MNPNEQAAPRPWKLGTDFEIIGADNMEVANVYQCGGIREADEADANARLIVAAVNSYAAAPSGSEQEVAREAAREILKRGLEGFVIEDTTAIIASALRSREIAVWHEAIKIVNEARHSGETDLRSIRAQFEYAKARISQEGE